MLSVAGSSRTLHADVERIVAVDMFNVNSSKVEPFFQHVNMFL